MNTDFWTDLGIWLLVGLTLAFLIRFFVQVWRNRNRVDPTPLPLWQWIVGLLAIVALCVRASCT